MAENLNLFQKINEVKKTVKAFKKDAQIPFVFRTKRMRYRGIFARIYTIGNAFFPAFRALRDCRARWLTLRATDTRCAWLARKRTRARFLFTF